MTTLIVDRTCIDDLMQYRVSAQNKNFHTSLIKSLFEQGLQMSRSAFKRTLYRSQEELAVLAEFRYESFTSPLLDDSELLDAIVMKSDHQLWGFLQQPRYLHALDVDTLADALTMSTITGWMNGCRVLLNANLMKYLEDPSSDAWRSKRTLLMLSAAINRVDMLQFWLSQREMCDEIQLSFIGHVEDALVVAEDGEFEVPTMEVIQLVSNHLLKQRQEVKLLMQKHELQYCCESARTSLPDAHVCCMLTALVSEGVDVPLRYWPKRKSLYYMPHMWKSDKLKMFETFGLGGICDVSQENFKCSKETACSPLVYLATQCVEGAESGYFSERNTTVRWFLSRGANMRETWPGTDTTALHCLAWQSADVLQEMAITATANDSLILEDSGTYEDYVFFAKEEILDQCECGCSRSGCDFLSCFWKGMFAETSCCPRFSVVCEHIENATLPRDLECIRYYAVDDKDKELRCGIFMRILLDLTLWVEKAATTLALDRLIHGYIRLFIFSHLEIRHTCCDIDRIRHHDDPDYTKQPYPRCYPTEIRRIIKEDAQLRARLEQLVPELITRYDSFGGTLQDFVIDVLIPTMRRTAKDLKEEDKALYAAGRRELGVIMNEDEDDTEEEGVDAEKEEEEADVEAESDDEY